MIRDLDDEGLEQNKVLCSSSRVKLLIVKLPLQAPWRSLRQGDRSLASCRLLALEPHWLGFLLIASSLSLFPYRLFLVASSLSPHLARFLARLINRPRFRFAGSWIVGLAMGKTESRGADVTVGFSGKSLWKVLTIFRRYMTTEEGSQVFSSSR